MLPLKEVIYIKDSFRISRLISATPGFRLVARKGLPRANPGLITRVRDKNLMIFNQAKDIEYWAAFQGRLIYLYRLVLLIPEDKLPA